MNYDNSNDHIQEQDVIEEKALAKFKLGRMSQRENGVNKYLQQFIQKREDEYNKYLHDRNLVKMKSIAKHIAAMLLSEVEKHDGEISDVEITTNEQETTTVVKATVESVFDFDSFSNRLISYLTECCDGGEIDSYDLAFTDSGCFSCVLKISEK